MRLPNHIRRLALNIRGSIPTRPLGKTGIEVPIFSLGGESLLKLEDKKDEAIELIQLAYQMGIKYFDTAMDYYPSELRLGEALKEVRKDVVIATKTDERTREGAWNDLQKSLENLKTDYIDIWQVHHVDHEDELKTLFGPDGAITAFKEAKKQGLVKHIGITGHYDPVPIMKAIKEFKFDTVLAAVNAADIHKHSFIRNVLPLANKKEMGIIGMKVCSRGRLFEPTRLNNMKDALEYVLSLPISTAIVGHDNVQQLVENIKIAQDFEPLTKTEMNALEKKTEDYSELSLYFRKDYEKFNPWWKPYGYEEKENKEKSDTPAKKS